jgi:hypothetical protein
MKIINMNKTKLAIFAGAAIAVAAISVLAVQAAPAPLAATCGSNVSGNVVTWTASATGGNTSTAYAFLWSGDASVAGSTSTSMMKTYTTNGTYNAMIQATDASSTMATSTCSATVTANVVPVATSTLNVFVVANNAAGGAATSSNFTGMVSGAAAMPSSFAGNVAGTAVVVNAGTAYTVSASSLTNYMASETGNCTGPIAAGASAICTVTETFVPPTVTPPVQPPLPRVNQPMLSIGGNGEFLARGMIVTSIASGSFQGQVWGVTYTVNWSGGAFPEFYLRKGNKVSAVTNPADQIAAGDEVGVAGFITTATPMTVNADVVRDYSITTVLPPGLRRGQPESPFYNGKGNGGGSGNGNGEGDNGQGASTTVSSSVNVQSHVNDLLNQLKNLENLFKGHGNGNGQGNN